METTYSYTNIKLHILILNSSIIIATLSKGIKNLYNYGYLLSLNVD